MTPEELAFGELKVNTSNLIKQVSEGATKHEQ
jgi:hypothetical protein